MTSHPTLGLVVGILLVGFIVGAVVGWAARTEQNWGWYAGVVRQLAQVRAQLDDTLDELDAAHAELDRVKAQHLNQSWAATPAPEIHVHVQATPALGYQDLTGATSRALAGQLPRVLEAGP